MDEQIRMAEKKELHDFEYNWGFEEPIFDPAEGRQAAATEIKERYEWNRKQHKKSTERATVVTFCVAQVIGFYCLPVALSIAVISNPLAFKWLFV